MYAGEESTFMKALLGLTLGAAVLGLAAGTADAGAIKCAYAPAGPAGPQGNRLDIGVNRSEESTAVHVLPGGRIQVTDDQRMRALGCRGRKPTVTNVDRIGYKAARSARNTNFTVVEPLGFTGVSIHASGRMVTYGTVGSDQADTVIAGVVHGVAGLDYGPDPAGVDVRIEAKNVTLVNVLQGGNDHFYGDGRGGLFDGPLKGAWTTVYGEGGNDEIVGGIGQDIIDGGRGKDTLSGSASADILSGGPGIDTFDGDGGNDEIDAIDRRAETVECGKGRDLAAIDLSDEDSNCESFSFP